MTIIYGWYSNKMKEQNIFHRFGRKKEPISNIYLSTDNKEVEVTIVSSKNDKLWRS